MNKSKYRIRFHGHAIQYDLIVADKVVDSSYLLNGVCFKGVGYFNFSETTERISRTYYEWGYNLMVGNISASIIISRKSL